MKLTQSLFDAFDLKAPLAGGVDRQGFWIWQSRQRSDDSQVFLKRSRSRAEPLLQNVFSVLEDPPVSLRCKWKEHVIVSNQETAALKGEVKFTVVEGLTVRIAKHRQQ